MHPHAVQRPGALEAPRARLDAPAATTALCRASVPPDRLPVAPGRPRRTARSRATFCRPPPPLRQPVGPPLVHAGALERVRGVQPGGRPERGERLVVHPHAVQRPGALERVRGVQPGGRPERQSGTVDIPVGPQRPCAPSAPSGALPAQAGIDVGSFPVPRYGPGPPPASLAGRPCAERGGCITRVNSQRPAVACGRPAVPAPSPLDVPHLDVCLRARWVGRSRGPIRPRHAAGRSRRGAADKGVPAFNAPQGPSFPPSALAFLLGGARRPARALYRLAIPHDSVGQPAASLDAGRDPAALVRTCSPQAVQSGGLFETPPGGFQLAGLPVAPAALYVLSCALGPGPFTPRPVG